MFNKLDKSDLNKGSIKLFFRYVNIKIFIPFLIIWISVISIFTLFIISNKSVGLLQESDIIETQFMGYSTIYNNGVEESYINYCDEHDEMNSKPVSDFLNYEVKGGVLYYSETELKPLGGYVIICMIVCLFSEWFLISSDDRISLDYYKF